ncbi:MAG TPA: ComF family protein, partial [Bacteroidales bacterium]|nr:ComF family protein [Bacteroidales bacterium]
HLLVCDDVLTTGATMEAALSKLVAVEGVRVSVVTLAVVG